MGVVLSFKLSAVKMEGESEKVVEEFRSLCSHYSRACSLVAPCCNKTYPCRLCHDEKETHEIDRFAVKEVVCRKCDKRQPVAESCLGCSIRFARYFCSLCNLYDDAEKGQYHCSKCGICRIGGRDNFIHCDTCGLCLQKSLQGSHKCVQEASRSNCPVCMEDIHTSRDPAHVPDCGHLLHKKCFTQMLENGLYQCPQCQTSLINMSKHWSDMDNERQRWVLPSQLREFQVKIQCRDCNEESETAFHFIGLKCLKCGSYNTVRNGNESLPLEDVDPSLPQGDNMGEEFHLIDPFPFQLQLDPTPSTDSDDEFETPPSPRSINEEDEEYEDDLSYADQLLGGIPLLPPWLPQHSDNPDMYYLTNQLPVHLNISSDSFDEEDEDQYGEEIHQHIQNTIAYAHLTNTLLPNIFGGDSDPDSDSGLPHVHVWEVDESAEEEQAAVGGDKGEGSDGWETASEEEVVGGDEENLGKEECHLTVQEESNQLGDVAPAD